MSAEARQDVARGGRASAARPRPDPAERGAAASDRTKLLRSPPALLLLAVALLVLAFPPAGLWPAALLAPWAVTRLATTAPGAWAAFRRVTLVGWIFFAVALSWLAETHPLNLVVVTAVEGLLVGAYGAAAHRVLRRGAVFPALPVLWTAHEMVRLSFPLSGFAWLFVGHAVAASPTLVQVADLGGVLAVTFVATSASACAMALAERRPGRLGAALVVVAAVAYGLVRPATLDEPEPGPVVAAIQPGFPQALKDDPITADERWRVCRAQTLELARARDDIRLLVFPETMWPWPRLLDRRPPGTAPSWDERVRRDQGEAWVLHRNLQAPFGDRPPRLLLGVLGVVVDGPGEPGRVNGALYVDEEGREIGAYDKAILVPGGEMLPVVDLLPRRFAGAVERWVVDLAGYLPDLEPGPGPSTLDLDGVPFGVTICYENAYGDYVRRTVGRGARFVVNLSNEAWFGESAEFDHMELHSILRAVETRRAIFRSTNSGVSCLVRPTGHAPSGGDRLVVDGRDRAVAGVLAAEVPLHTGSTLYVAWGDWLGWATGLAAVWLVGRARRRGRLDTA